MSSAPPGIKSLDSYLRQKLGAGQSAGIVGDTNHKAGYHLGPDRTPSGDYSEKLSRDRSGASRYPYYASAIDVGMGWSRSREWVANLVLDARAGKEYTRDIREIIGSIDGRNALYWDSQAGFRAVAYTGSDHIDHTHISFFRDSADRDQSQVLRQFLEPSKPLQQEQEDDMINERFPVGFACDENQNVLDESKMVAISLEPANKSFIGRLGKGAINIVQDFGPGRFRVAIHRGTWFQVEIVDVDSNGDTTHTRAFLNLEEGADAVFAGRMKRSATDTADSRPAAISVIYDHK